MDNQMMDMMAGDAMLLRRLEAYAELRLSPDLTTSSRLRARVLAVAHRQAALARADTGLTVLPHLEPMVEAAPFSPRAQQLARTARARRGRPWGRIAAVVLAASLSLSVAVGGAFAARPGAPLYDARVWAETLTLPSDPSARALAQLERLKDRLREIGEASRAGDAAGATAALAAYEDIVDQASASAILADDDVAAAVLETGVGRNLEVLQALLARVPDQASAAISRALDAAIARSTDAIDRIHASRPSGPANGGGGGGPATGPAPHPTKAPTAKPTRAPVSTATPKPKPTHKPTPEPAATAEPAATPERTPKPRVNQGEEKPPDAPAPGGNAESKGD